MPLSFPSNPTTGQTSVQNGRTYVWNGSNAWELSNNTANHASTHGAAGADPVSIAASQIASGTVATARLGSGTADATTFLRGDQSYAVPTKTLVRWTATQNQPPASSFAQLDTRNSIAVLAYDAATQEDGVFVGTVPDSAPVSSGFVVRLWWMAASATSGNVRWQVQFEADGTDNDADSFDTATAATAAASGTSGIETVTEITATTIDSLTAGKRFRLKVTRVAADAADTMTGDAQLVAVELRVP